MQWLRTLTPFEQQLFITVVDKALIGVLVLVAGFFLNRSLEAFRGQQTLRNELEKLRDAKHLDYLDRQLSNFYWPIYIRLHLHKAVWKRILNIDEGNNKVRAEIERTFILPNHEEVVRIIESNIHLMEANTELFSAVRQYVRYVAVYRAMRIARGDDNLPTDLGEPWPDKFLSEIQRTANKLQRKYDSLLENRQTKPSAPSPP
jgi:hypothetical protein